jgi:cytochrome c biogenesis protein CcmG/thiol:disulfide interchange protein DsbE
MTSQPPTEPAFSQRGGSVPRVLAAVVGLGLLGLVAFGFLSSNGGRPQPGEIAPAFDLVLLDGSPISLDDLRGQVVVLNFWASWCGPCRNEAPALQSVWEAYQDRGVVFLGINYRDAPAASQAFIQEYGITYHNAVDVRSRVSTMYGVTAVPETFVIDGQGKVAWVQIGEVTAETLARELDRIQANQQGGVQ